MADSLRIGIAGLGTVGASLVRILQQRSNELAITCGRAIEIIAVSARDRSRDRGIDLKGITWFDTPEQMASEADIDVFVELVGGASGQAENAVRAALARGLHVVTANKALLAKHGVELATIAEDKVRFSISKRRWLAVSPSSRRCVSLSPATMCRASTAS